MKRLTSFSAIAVISVSILMAVCVVSNITAQDLNYGDPKPERESKRAGGLSISAKPRGSMHIMSHVGDSPFPAPTPTDSKFVVDTGFSGLDTGCQFRSEGSLKFTVEITRVVGLTDSNGKLTNPQQLIDNGVIAPKVTLEMPAFDVDYNTVTFPPDQPERDRIFVNGEFIGNLGVEGYLDGENNKWRINRVKVPVSAIKFAQKQASGPPTPGLNEIEILIDQGNIANNKELWCTSIDWAAIEVKALYPVVMLHGNGETGLFWNRMGFTTPFALAGIPIDISISNGTNPIFFNAAQLAGKVPAIAIKFGVRHLHFVAHSKGGLDSRAFLKLIPQDTLAILSVTTLSTPHHGSVLADYIRDARGASAWHSEDSVRTAAIQLLGGPFDTGRQNLTTSFVRDFNQKNLPLPTSFTVQGETTPVKYFSWGADANADNSMSILGNPTISNAELEGTDKNGGWKFTEWGGNLVYRIVYYVASTYVDYRIVSGKKVKIVREVQNATVQPNDMLVSLSSSRLPQYIPMTDVKRNHATVADGAMAQLVIQLIKTTQSLE